MRLNIPMPESTVPPPRITIADLRDVLRELYHADVDFDSVTGEAVRYGIAGARRQTAMHKARFILSGD
jgi:hypothetical protein